MLCLNSLLFFFGWRDKFVETSLDTLQLGGLQTSLIVNNFLCQNLSTGCVVFVTLSIILTDGISEYIFCFF